MDEFEGNCGSKVWNERNVLEENSLRWTFKWRWKCTSTNALRIFFKFKFTRKSRRSADSGFHVALLWAQQEIAFTAFQRRQQIDTSATTTTELFKRWLSDKALELSTYLPLSRSRKGFQGPPNNGRVCI